MAIHTQFRPHPIALALLALHGPIHAQTAPEQVTISSRPLPSPASVAGFGDTPLSRSPFQAVTLGNGTLADSGASSLADITRLDASIADAYNAPGYWSALTVRGFVLDNRFNFQRDGLAINAETAISLENKERIEVLKGTSGAQAGTSSPGGLANFVVKRPRGMDQAQVLIGWTDRGSIKAAADIERRLGEGDTGGLRLNAAVESLDPLTRGTRGERQLLAAAVRAKLGPGTLDGEIEWSHQSQPSVPAFSLLGSRLPPAADIDPRTNLNNQRWSLPVVFDGTTASLRWTQPLQPGWQLVAHAMSQQLRTDDRIAFPFGCSAEEAYDRYCSDGSMDLYDFRSEGEHRQTTAGALTLNGRFQLSSLANEFSTGLSWSQYNARLGRQAFNWAGVGQIDGSVQVDAQPDLTDENTNRSERSTELHLRDVISLTSNTRLWLGARHTQLSRDSVRTDGSRATRYDQRFTTPWLALSHQWNAATLLYASWGQGVESDVAPNRSRYTNAGEPLPAMKSEQSELGLKIDEATWAASFTAFDIRRPAAVDLGRCDDDGTCTRLVDGNARHRGVEASSDLRLGAVTLRASTQWLRAQREGASNATDNGLTPTNVAERSARLAVIWQVAAVPGLSTQASLSAEGPRYVLPDNSLRTPGWASTGLSARYTTQALGRAWLLRLGVDNLFDQRAWKESPYQFGHAYLYPLAPRTWRASIQATL